MNLELLQIHIDNSVYVKCPQLAADGSNARDFFLPDVLGKKRFAHNFGGHLRSDVAVINAQTNAQIQAALFAELTDYTPSTNPTAGLQDAEIMLSHRSKYCQSPAEMQDWICEQIRIRDEKAAAASSDVVKQGDIDFSDNPNPDENE